MTFKKKVPWDEIEVPDTDYNVRLVQNAGKIRIYWGRDSRSHCLLIIELEGKHSEHFQQERIKVRGLHIDLRQGDIPGTERLVLTLDKEVDRDLFQGLCETLVESLQQVTDSSIALSVSMAHLKRWKAFLAGNQAKILSAEEIRGLFAELHFLRTLYSSGSLDQYSAVEAWCGSEGIHQDFIFGDTAIEVKSLCGKDRNTVHISSENQLTSIVTHLFLMTYRLSDRSSSKKALSLNTLVRQIDAELTDAEAIEEFSRKLSIIGYMSLHEYDRPEFTVVAEQAYCVTENFPRLIRSALPLGVMNVSYEIELEKLFPFCCDTSIIFEE